MRIVIAGSSGLVGAALIPFLEGKGHDVYRLVRNKETKHPKEIVWDPSNKQLAADQIENFDAFINLAGDPIAEGRWKCEKKKRIFDSRIQSTELLAKTIANLSHKPKVFINASAVGFYGNNEDQWITEISPNGSGFLADVCKAWEEAAAPAVEAGIRVVKLRFGVVLSSSGGALKQMLLPFKLGLGGVIGNGKQYMSWIMIEDLVEIIEQALTNVYYTGPINVVTDNPVTNKTFTKTLGTVLHRPTLFPMPAFLARLVFGEVADALLLSSCRVKPQKLIDLGYKFRFPMLQEGLKNALDR